MPRDDWSDTVPPLQHPDDPLRFVKEYVWGLAMDKLGITRHRRYTDLPDDVKFVYNRVVPALVDAILADDPDWNPDDEWLKGRRPPTVAKGTAALRWFVEIQELQKATFELSSDLLNSALYDRLYRDHDRHGCFLSDLRTALMKGDPEWRGPYIDTTPPLPT
ncbi:hypothetical protein [Nocardia farcinica]|uniref:Uncharacterized protein n=1 Tax=Nocardia farcinica (strain IFM 10152) TaxID=247156 RepID=Q5YST8_NOCFA|nr:hypothetical protein [Nocardia farcinica]BAD58753.1 hypothetical protein NFA_39050 [Nocardia farcinica IFM 10152]